MHGGTPCPETLTRVQVCNDQSCPSHPLVRFAYKTGWQMYRFSVSIGFAAVLFAAFLYRQHVLRIIAASFTRSALSRSQTDVEKKRRRREKAKRDANTHAGRPDQNPRHHVADEIEANYHEAQDHLRQAQLDGLATLRNAFEERDFERLYFDSKIAQGVPPGQTAELTQRRLEWLTSRYDKWYDRHLDYKKLKLEEKKIEAEEAHGKAVR